MSERNCFAILFPLVLYKPEAYVEPVASRFRYRILVPKGEANNGVIRYEATLPPLTVDVTHLKIRI